MAYNILLVDDDKVFREEFRDFLYDYNVVEASNGKEALDLLSRPNEIDVVILDVVMPGLPGTEVLKHIKAMCPDLGVVILTGHGSKSTVVEALKGRADDYIEKPIDIHRTREIVQRLIEQRKPPEGVAPGGIDARMTRVEHFLRRNYDKRVTLKDAARLVALSPKYLSRIFKARTGMSFGGFRLRVRMEKAAELLEKTDYSIEEISYKLGYENAESFARLFKRIKRCTPTDYRNSRRRGAGRSSRDSTGDS
jgi:two-component system response regulator YesN